MKASYSWIREFVDIKMSPQKLGDALSMAGLSVASLEEIDGDFVYDIEVTSNRPDWLSIRGIAREVAAIAGAKLKKEAVRKTHRPKNRAKDRFSIRIDDKKGCSLYCGNLIVGVKVGPSPEWLKKRLLVLGLRPVNSVVDITNYCLMEYGQPLHAFDLDRIPQASLIVRRARSGEKIVLIDGFEKALSPQVLVIADSDRPIAAAGLMGGQATEVNAQTKNVLLESACFDPVTVRHGARVLGVASDSSYRFERGVDLVGVKEAMARATEMICELCNGTLVVSKQAGAGKAGNKRKITVSLKEVRDVLSIDISTLQAKGILEKLGFGTRLKAKDILEVIVPSFRKDVKIPEDLTEEIARIYGYDRIPLTAPSIKPFSFAASQTQLCELRLKGLLAGMGLKEIITYSLGSDEDYRKTSLEVAADAYALENPLSQDYRILRTTVLPGLLAGVAFNINHNNKNGEVFEISRVYTKNNEEIRLGIALFGSRRAAWLKESCVYTLFDLKGILEALLDEFQVSAYVLKDASDWKFALVGTACHVLVNDQIIARFGQVSEEVKRNWGIKAKEDIFVAEVLVDILAASALSKKTFHGIATTPSIVRDISMLVPDSVSFSRIEELIGEKARGYVQRLALAERYQGIEVPKAHSGLTLSIEYSAGQRTLTDEEINPVHQRVLDSLSEELGLKLR
jgi:phenylalanyl-tRNA synthetase beta chain